MGESKIGWCWDRCRGRTPAPDSFGTKLLSLLPRGYDDRVCEPVSPPAAGALATVDCGQASQQGGPASARYSRRPASPRQGVHSLSDNLVDLHSWWLKYP